MEYKILMSKDVAELADLTTQALKDGYTLAGGVSVCSSLTDGITFLQSVYKTA